jgi:EAL domain-containing protein (putative c-di-GMP-specific phosphodiesterase class I)
MHEADLAMYAAKSQGKCRVECYDPVLHSTVVEQHALRGDLAEAVGRGELVLDYQPVVDLRTEEIVGVEALVRWQHPSRGLLPPSAFIDLAEKTGSITAIGEWVLTTAAQQMRHWQERHGRTSLWLSVNVSVRQLEEPGFAELVTRVLRDTDLDPATLILEVTESVLASPTGGAAEALEDLRRTGVRVALDDFGTGYCSIDYLRQLPLDVLKIDRSFVSGPESSTAGYALLEAIVALGQHLGLDVIPEGIERPGELVRMRALGCATGQGYLLSRPVPPAELGARLAAATSPGSLLVGVTQRSSSPDSDRTPRRCA